MGENGTLPLIPVYLYDETKNSVTRLDQLRPLTESELLPDDPGPPGEPGVYRGVDLSFFSDFTTVTISGIFRLKRMSRKRFTKLLMAHGCPRNFSNELAAYWHKQRVPYAGSWLYMLTFCFR